MISSNLAVDAVWLGAAPHLPVLVDDLLCQRRWLVPEWACLALGALGIVVKVAIVVGRLARPGERGGHGGRGQAKAARDDESVT